MQADRPEESPRLPEPTPGLILEPMGQETLVYNSRTSQAHVLNTVCSIVFMSCEEGRTLAETAQALAEDAEISPEASESVVQYAVRLLARAKLVSEGAMKAAARLTRRQLIRRGLAAAVLPAVITVLTPTPAFAVSCVTGAQCTGATGPTYCGRPACTSGRVCGASSAGVACEMRATSWTCPCS